MPRDFFVSRRLTFAGLVLLILLSQNVFSQSAAEKTQSFYLEEAVNFALQHYPVIRASMERLAAAKAGVGLAQTNYLPRADALWQVNRASRNNIFGLLLPQNTIPSVSGPVLSSTSNQGVWGSAAGLLFSWEPFDFGYRRAVVMAARATESQSSAEIEVTRLDVAVATLNACLTLLAAEQSVRAAQADVDRRSVFAKSVHVLVDNQLRAGADASRADAELARARVGLARARQQQEVSRASLADFLGIADISVEIRPAGFGGLPSEMAPPVSPLTSHPFAQSQQARIEQLRSQVHIFDRAYFPKFDFQSAIYGRGSGANTDGTFAGGTNGLGLERYNWAVGLTVKFPIFDIFSIRSRKEIAEANEKVEEARYDQTLQDLTGQWRKAQASLEGARQVAENTPVELEAARATETQERARYQAGLATIVNVSDAQGLLVQAEIDDALARLAVWQNLAAVYASRGDLQPFFNALHEKTQGGP